MQIVTFRLQMMALAEENYGTKMHLRHKIGGDREQKAEKKRRKWIRKENIELGSRDSMSRGDRTSAGLGPPQAVQRNV